MDRTLVAYFSASGRTARLAGTLADAIGADLHEIVPVEPYTEAELNWMDPNSRSSIEMKDKKHSRPAVANSVYNMDDYDTIFVGFPIWWYTAPTIINTFLEQYDLTGKTIVPFATSGTSQMGGTNDDLAPSCPGATLKEGLRFKSRAPGEELKAWADKVLK